MKFFHKVIFTGALLVGYSSSSHAVLVDQGSTTLQTSTGLEWLDLTETVNMSIADILNDVGGFISDGWSFATVDKVESLFLEAGATGPFDQVGLTADIGTIAAANQLADMLGQTALTSFPATGDLMFQRSYGVALNNEGTVGYHLYADVAVDGSLARVINNPFVSCPISSGCFETASSPFIGNYLVRASVPEPATGLLFMIGLIGFWLTRRSVNGKRSIEGVLSL